MGLSKNEAMAVAVAVAFPIRTGALKTEADVIEIVFRDTGEGIRSEFLPYVFDRFKQADPSITRKHGGLGLGLAITRHLTELHGGTIRAESDGEGRGATFTVSLPITGAQPQEGQPLQLNESDRDEEFANMDDSPNLAGIKVLAIEDDQDSREFLRIVLEGFGADIVTASSAREGQGSRYSHRQSRHTPSARRLRPAAHRPRSVPAGPDWR